MKKYWGMFLLIIFAIACITSNTLAQETEKEKSKTIEFGASLKPDFSKKDKKSENKVKAKSSTDEDVIRVDTDLVTSDVMVLDKTGRLIKGLKKEDFIVKEDGAPQLVETFSQGDGGTVPRSIVLVMDYSGSLLPYIQTSVAAAKTLVDKLKPIDRMAIVTDDVELLTGFTHDKELLKDKLDSLEKKALSRKPGRSQQYSALYATLNELFDEEDVRPIIIFQTDGDEYPFLKDVSKNSSDESSNNSSGPSIKSKRLFSYADVLTSTEKARATVYTIIPGYKFIGLSPEEQVQHARMMLETRDKAMSQMFSRPAFRLPEEDIESRILPTISMALRFHQPIDALAKFTGGWADYLEKPEQANEVYSRVLADINNRYLIGYYPANQARDGKRRKIKIEIRDHPEYIVWGRKAYYAPSTQ